MKSSIYIVLFFLPLCLFADLNVEMNKFFNSLGASANVSSADVYQGQKAGYLTGGGMAIRSRVVNSNLATVNLPKFDAGCGGIDIYAGGFSFINSDQLVTTLKSIGSSAVGYAFLLGLETVSPQVANTIKQMQSWANTINSASINSCETASQLVGAVWPRNTMANQQICRSVGGKKKLFSDFIAARHKCSQLNQYEQLMNDLDGDGAYKDLLVDEYNVAWQAIQKQKFLLQNPELAEFFMSLMGTVIVRKDNEISIEVWPSKISDESFLNTLLEGGEANVYACKSDSKRRCLMLQEKTVSISHNHSWIGRIKEMLIAMQNKILNDEELSDAEREMLAKSKLPLYRIVNVLTAYKKGYCPIDLYQVADVVAMDLLVQFLREATELVRSGAKQLKNQQMYANAVDEYLDELSRIEDTVKYYENRNMRLMDREFQTMQKIQIIEEQIASEIVLD